MVATAVSHDSGVSCLFHLSLLLSFFLILLCACLCRSNSILFELISQREGVRFMYKCVMGLKEYDGNGWYVAGIVRI